MINSWPILSYITLAKHKLHTHTLLTTELLGRYCTFSLQIERRNIIFDMGTVGTRAGKIRLVSIRIHSSSLPTDLANKHWTASVCMKWETFNYFYCNSNGRTPFLRYHFPHKHLSAKRQITDISLSENGKFPQTMINTNAPETNLGLGASVSQNLLT